VSWLSSDRDHSRISASFRSFRNFFTLVLLRTRKFHKTNHKTKLFAGESLVSESVRYPFVMLVPNLKCNLIFYTVSIVNSFYAFADDFIANCKIPLSDLIEKESQPSHDIWVNLEPKVSIVHRVLPFNNSQYRIWGSTFRFATLPFYPFYVNLEPKVGLVNRVLPFNNSQYLCQYSDLQPFRSTLSG